VKRDVGHRAPPNTPEGRKKLRIVGAAIGAAAVLAIAAPALVGDHSLSMKLFGIAAGIMFVGIVYIFTNRRAR
jgi:glucose-6-phosphate-specific signal transduction histidine kinase